MPLIGLFPIIHSFTRSSKDPVEDPELLDLFMARAERLGLELEMFRWLVVKPHQVLLPGLAHEVVAVHHHLDVLHGW